MKILAVNGSPRKKGNTASLIERALEGASRLGAETKIIHLGDISISGCTGCEGCRDSFNCVIQDDMQDIYPQMLEADGLICASPTYFYNITSLMKAFIERCYCLENFDPQDRSRWVSAIEASGGKYASVISVCEQHSEEDMGFTAPAMTMSLQSLGYRVVDDLKAVGYFGPGVVRDNDSLMREAEDMGARLAGTILLRKRT